MPAVPRDAAHARPLVGRTSRYPVGTRAGLRGAPMVDGPV